MGRLILVVEDQVEVSRIITSQLEKLGFNVLQAFNGESAINIYRNRNSEICTILLDMGLPDIHGSQCIDEFKKINNDVRIIICSGMRYDNYNELGAVDRIQKPFAYNELKEMCNKYSYL